MTIEELGWPGRTILEYDSGIQGRDDCEPNLDLFS
jgi:hypothetical protein